GSVSAHAEERVALQEAGLKRARLLVSRYLSRHPPSELAQRIAQSPLARDLAWRNEAWKELLLGERVYIANLVALYEGYHVPLKSRKKLLPDTAVRLLAQSFAKFPITE